MGLRKYNNYRGDDTWGSGSTMCVEKTILGAQEVQGLWRRRYLGLRKYNEWGGDDTWGSGSTMSGAETVLGAQEVQ